MTRPFRRLLPAAAALVFPALTRAAITADTVVGYTPGDFTATGSSTAFQTATAALGPLAGDTGYGGLNPFNPAFSPSQIVIVGAGGQLTLHLSAAARTTGGPSLGVVANNGIQDVSGNGTAGNPAMTFGDPPEAVVSVSADGVNFVTLFGGQPVTFANPANYYTDQPITNDYQSLGSAVADQSKPFTGTLASFNGETYDQIKTTLAGSAGGTWLDLSGSGLSSVNDVRFTVPTGASYRMVVDSVSAAPAAVPEPTTGAVLVAAGLLGRRRRR